MTSRILGLPSEIRTKIWSEALQHTSPVKPNKPVLVFGAFKYKRWKACDDPGIDVLNLSLTCRSIYKDIIPEDTFYKVNNFEFLHNRDVIAYTSHLIQTVPRRLNAIRSIILELEPGNNSLVAFIALTLYRKLQYLSLGITLCSDYFDPGAKSFKDVAGYSTLLEMGVLRELKLNFGTEKYWNFPERVLKRIRMLDEITNENMVDLEKEVRELESVIFSVMSRPKDTNHLCTALAGTHI